MPSSRPTYTSWLCDFILKEKPKSILDIGVGFGSFGVLAREYTDIWNGWYHRSLWKTILHGVEAFEKYHNPLYNLYDYIFWGDICNVVNYQSFNMDYDLIVMKDVIEHIDKTKGMFVVEALLKRCKWLVIITPIEVHEQDAVFGNEYERHISQWGTDDFGNIHEYRRRENALLMVLQGKKGN
jgi:hypothetical protein